MSDHSTPPTAEELAERIRRRKLVSQLYLRGSTEAAIAEELDVPQPAVARDITHLGEQWRTESEREPRFRHERELARIDYLEYETWLAWDASKQPTRKVHVVRDEKGGEKTASTLIEKGGDPRYLGLIHKCALLRRIAAEKIHESSQPFPMGPPTDEQVKAEMDILLPALEKINAHVRDLKAQGGPFPPGYDPGPDFARPQPDRPPNAPSADHFPHAPFPDWNAPSELGGETETGRCNPMTPPPASAPAGDGGPVSQPANPQFNPNRPRGMRLPPNAIILGPPDAPRPFPPGGTYWSPAPQAPSGSSPHLPEGQAPPRPNREETGP